MFGFGKKKQLGSTTAASNATTASLPALNVADENFIVMPSQYLPKRGTQSGRGKKIYWLAGGAVLFLLFLSGGLYIWFTANRSPAPFTAPITSPPPRPPSEESSQAPTSTPPSLSEQPERIITNQAYDANNQLVGNLIMTIPWLVTSKYGESMGITVLSAADLALPEGSELAGGIYAPYPLGVTFDEPIAFKLSAIALSTPESRQDFSPAYLKGITWEVLTASQEGEDGWSFSFNKFPTGPLALVRRVPESGGTATSTEASIEKQPVTTSQDSDGDGLTDREEVVLGSNISSPDSDGDGYQDKTEISNGYNPLAVQEKLDNAKFFTNYTNPTYGYKVMYPAKWLADSLDQTNKQVLFISESEEFFEVLVEENPLKAPIVDWYRSQSPALANVPLDVTVVGGEGAVWSPDSLTLYVGKDALVYVLIYNKGTLEAVNWPTFFEYFYRSFQLGNTSSATDNITP